MNPLPFLLRWLPVAEPLARAALSAVASKHGEKLTPDRARELADIALARVKYDASDTSRRL